MIKISRNDLSKETRGCDCSGELEVHLPGESGDLVLALGSPVGLSDSVVCGRVTSTTNVKSMVDSEYHPVYDGYYGETAGKRGFWSIWTEKY